MKMDLSGMEFQPFVGRTDRTKRDAEVIPLTGEKPAALT
jgi:hypothetical protein